MAQMLPTFSTHQQGDAPHTCLLSDEAFEQLYDLVGLFGKQPVFTLEGDLVLIVAPGGAHNGLVQGVTNSLIDLVHNETPQRYWVYQERNIRLRLTENPIVPDIAVYDRELRYTQTSPVVVPVVAIEGGLSTRQQDHMIKAPHYAQAGVQELWLISMPDLSRYPLATGYLLDTHSQSYTVAVHEVLSPQNGLFLQTLPFQIKSDVLSQSFQRYGIPITELKDWPAIPGARELTDTNAE
jgi:Uma2 family endonuclease